MGPGSLTDVLLTAAGREFASSYLAMSRDILVALAAGVGGFWNLRGGHQGGLSSLQRTGRPSTENDPPLVHSSAQTAVALEPSLFAGTVVPGTGLVVQPGCWEWGGGSRRAVGKPARASWFPQEEGMPADKRPCELDTRCGPLKALGVCSWDQLQG